MSITGMAGMAELAGEAAKVEELQDALKHELIDLLEKSKNSHSPPRYKPNMMNRQAYFG
ncbi:MAG: hypothetical protein ACJASL_003764 [Paraglaciecola sp.]|jgi:hypothetical protein